MCGNTLSRVILLMGTDYQQDPASGITPDVFIRHCPNLKHFAFVGNIKNPTEYRPFTALADFQHQHLDDLALNISNMEDRLNALVYLEIAPKLKRFGIALSNILYTAGASISEKVLRLRPELNIVVLAGESSSTLLSGYTNLYDEDMLRYLSHFRFPFLRRLILAWSIFWDGEYNLRRFFQHAVENLTSLLIQHDASYINDELLTLVATHAQNLQEIGLCGGSYTSNGLKQFLETMAHPERTLRKVNFNTAHAVDTEVLGTIAASQLCIINEMVLFDIYRMGLKEMQNFLDAMVESDKTMDHLRLVFYQEMEPHEFVETNTAKEFLEKIKINLR
ncbi:hypothetical protein BDA99DRAFT_535746 [Phascolomyces articulosus]|uniref:Uncharacterized protein n=1 Tax=Phascolomyces articulosus TaxID=60185 RepID=A0AAD5PHJ9_9FUNG|nr:hypothetical protein BDA99DRAFT_535746 [Phascolomyces articulosus]